MEEENQTQTSKSFTSKQSLSSSIKKSEKALPFSPRKKKDVISGLAERYKLRIKYVERRGRKAHTLTEEQQKWLNDAFVNPGRKDNVYVGKKDGERQYVQKLSLIHI